MYRVRSRRTAADSGSSNRLASGEPGEREDVRLVAGAEVGHRLGPHVARAGEAGDEDDRAALAGDLDAERLRDEPLVGAERRRRAHLVVGARVVRVARRPAAGRRPRGHQERRQPVHARTIPFTSRLSPAGVDFVGAVLIR